MKIICIKNTAKNLDLTIENNIFTNNYHYDLTIGREYIIMGMAIYKKSNCLYYLINQNRFPDWYPYMLFNVIDNKIPADWYTYVPQQDDPGDISFLMGFDELCNDNDFYDALMDREKQAMLTYFERKEEAERNLL